VAGAWRWPPTPI